MVSPESHSQPSAMRKVARFCSSSIFPTRRIGFIFEESSKPPPGRRRLLAPSVGNGPGAMALRRMPKRPHSTASDFVMTCRPAFDMAEGTTYGEPVWTRATRIESTVTLWPPPIQPSRTPPGRPASQSSAPSARYLAAISLPRPVPPPVTRMRLPLRRFSLNMRAPGEGARILSRDFLRSGVGSFARIFDMREGPVLLGHLDQLDPGVCA